MHMSTASWCGLGFVAPRRLVGSGSDETSPAVCARGCLVGFQRVELGVEFLLERSGFVVG
jgi:hypothetical protein